jgi:hypothetical protein
MYNTGPISDVLERRRDCKFLTWKEIISGMYVSPVSPWNSHVCIISAIPSSPQMWLISRFHGDDYEETLPSSDIWRGAVSQKKTDVSELLTASSHLHSLVRPTVCLVRPPLISQPTFFRATYSSIRWWWQQHLWNVGQFLRGCTVQHRWKLSSSLQFRMIASFKLCIIFVLYSLQPKRMAFIYCRHKSTVLHKVKNNFNLYFTTLRTSDESCIFYRA